MSKAGIQSNRGDGYQTLVAMDWALTVMSDPAYAWVEVDSVLSPVDDVVIGLLDRSRICCQCKKNQALHTAWSIADLQDELLKAASLLNSDAAATVRFYSRSPFGELSALKEYSTTYPDATTYSANLGKAHRKTDSQLKDLFVYHSPSLSTYEFLRRTYFEPTPDLDRMETLLLERLRQLVTRPSEAYAALWTCLDKLGMRMASGQPNAAGQHRLNKADLLDLLTRAGALMAPTMEVANVLGLFRGTSAIGRSWQREIGGLTFASAVVTELLQAIEGKHRSILLTGLPGSGKTCAMLALQDELEKQAKTRSDLVPLFIQSREFADTATVHDRQVQGLPDLWVEQVARVAEHCQVVVVIDSLDVLSIAREHSVLDYFLAQVDRLLVIPNVTVVTSCRDFDRQYDRRIAQRIWDRELKCEPLDWDREITPLLAELAIDASLTDATTRELIRNPRELALYVELAMQSGGFNVVTSQSLAQRYLATVIQGNPALGDAAMQVIEELAGEMLQSRSLSVPSQRFTASQAVQRELLSHNVLHLAQGGQLTFGHQTLLDVLVISGAIRAGLTLDEFIGQLPPVPFVRPSIRSFVAHLASGERRQFRSQIRTVLTGARAFHIRRLVAECLAELAPECDDWPLIRDLRNGHQDVFQVIYTQGHRLEWHYFWMKFLVPALKAMADADGQMMHVQRVAEWKNDDPAGIVGFWGDMLGQDGLDQSRVAFSITHSLSQMRAEHSAMIGPLVSELLQLPGHERTFLGPALARCVQSYALDDSILWLYVAGDVRDEDVLSYRLGDDRLHCQPHEFGAENSAFLSDRMQTSPALLDLAVSSIERWSQIRNSRYGEPSAGYWSRFLRETSQRDAHSQTEHRYVDSERILLDVIESGILHQTQIQSEWWERNRERLCFSKEGALRYFGILACTANPSPNLEIISRMLSDKAYLESELAYELGNLMQKSFGMLDAGIQDAVEAVVLSIHQERLADPTYRAPVLYWRAQYLLTIPGYLRSPAANELIRQCERETWPLVRKPDIGARGGFIGAPFSFEVFLSASDEGVVRLLAHYSKPVRESFDDFLIGGVREVGGQLREAASRDPLRFLALLPTYWAVIAPQFCDDILEGVSNYLAHRYGNLQASSTWLPIKEPDAEVLAQNILDELDRHPAYWHHRRSASAALRACGHVLRDTQDAAQLVFWAIDFLALQEERPQSGGSRDLIEAGLNMARGNAVESLMILANHLQKCGAAWPELLCPALRMFAKDDDPALRAMLLHQLPYFQSHHAELGWDLFELAIQDQAQGLWLVAEPCLYHAYHQHFEIVEPWLKRLYCDGNGKDLEAWGRVSALAALNSKLEIAELVAGLNTLESADAWRGAATVWTHPGNMRTYRSQCLFGLAAGIAEGNKHSIDVARLVPHLFRESDPLVSLPIDLIRRSLALLASQAELVGGSIFGMDAWLNATSQYDPGAALDGLETYLHFVRHTRGHLYDHENNLMQLLTHLFRQAEEHEESDKGAMLGRVVSAQDELLALGIQGMDEWLKVAERP